MTLETTENKVQYTTNGSTVAFSITFKFLDNTHIVAYFEDSDGVVEELDLTTDFTLSGAGSDSGGTLTTVATLETGGTLTILREVPYTQDMDLVNGDSFDANILERAHDLHAMQIQQLAEVMSRAVVLPVTTTKDTPDLDSYITPGVMRFATAAEVLALAEDEAAISPADVGNLFASDAEAQAGVVANKILTPWGFNKAIHSYVFRATDAADGVCRLSSEESAVNGATVESSSAVTVRDNIQQWVTWTRETSGGFPPRASSGGYPYRWTGSIPPPSFNFFAPSRAIPSTLGFTRASNGWYFGADGTIRVASTNVPRYHCDPTSGAMHGLRIEAAATRRNLVSALPTVAENITVSAVAHTLSFYGTGTVTLSGTHSAAVAGAGNFPTRKTYTFTPSAGTLTMTPSGTVQNLQLETGVFASSMMLGEGSTVTRAVDVAAVTLSDIEFSATEGTLFIEARTPTFTPAASLVLTQIDTGAATDRIYISRGPSKIVYIVVYVSNSITAILNMGAVENDTTFRLTFSWKANDFRAALNAGTDVVATSAIPTGLTTMRLGSSSTAAVLWQGSINHYTYWPRVLNATTRRAFAVQ
jgi:hypothetical protein